MRDDDWKSWRTCGDWLNEGQKRRLDEIGAIALILFYIGLYIWMVMK